MLINLMSIGKTIGAKQLYSGLDLTIQTGEKVGMVGRNGIGKTTLLGIMAGTDHEFNGQVEKRRGLVVASTAQEHHGVGNQIVLEYILDNLPEYAKLKHITDSYPETMGDDMKLIGEYTDALTRFGELGYYDIEARAKAELEAFQLTEAMMNGPLERLSGGQKRFVELVKVTLSEAHLALIDEPTNHMDYVAKATFIEWLKQAQDAVVVITHDRDVLAQVDRIIEIKDHVALSYPGNYDAYLKQNGEATMSQMESYEQGQKRVIKLDKQIREAKAKKAGWSGTADKTNPFMLLEKRLTKEKEELLAKLQKPSFWIDREQLDGMKDKMVEKYDRYKARNIRIHTHDLADGYRQLLQVDHVSLGYDKPLFEDISFELKWGERLELKGRNGVGKSTLVKAILATEAGKPLGSKVYGGLIDYDPKLKIGVYEQEIDARYLPMPLGEALATVYGELGVAVNEQKIKQVLADYLFDPMLDYKLPIERLSGGQKARFQLIKMLCAAPNLLILDEPTNHLDLPSIEELEKTLENYGGAILYISHDSYFTHNVGGETVEVKPVSSVTAG